MPTANERLRDAAVSHQIYLTRYSTGVVKRMLALINRADQDMIRRLRARNLPGARTKLQRERLEKLIDGLAVINARGYSAYREALRSELKEINAYELEFLARQIEGAIVVDLAATVPAAGTIYSAALTRPMQGRYLRQWFDGLEQNKRKAVADAIRLGVVEGETIDDIVRRLRGTRSANYRNGILAIHRRHAEGVARTAVNHVVSNARRRLMRANSDIVKAWQYVATLDGRTTDICMSLDGKTYKLRGEGPEPPQHFNCRSTMTPVTKSWRELGFDKDELDPGTRASMNGQVSAKETYQSWLKKRPAKFQNEVLGQKKARLFREGGVTLDRFVDRSGRSYTLDQLRRVEADAWESVFGG